MAADVAVRDIAYHRSGALELLARLYTPRGGGPFPAVVDVHGGAWTSGDRLQNEAIHKPLAEAGIMVLALDFQAAPKGAYPVAVQEVNLGIRWMKAHAAELGSRTDLVGGLAGSSGAQTLLLNMLKPKEPRYAALKLAEAPEADASLAYVVACWPVADPVARYRMVKANGNERLVNNHHLYWGPEGAVAEASPQHILEAGRLPPLPPLLIIQGTSDDNLTPDMADRFEAAYRRAGGQVEQKKYAGQPHTFITKTPTAPESLAAIDAIKEFILAQAAQINARRK